MKTHLNPESLARNPAFSQVVVVEAPAKTIYVGGQNAVTPDGTIVGDTLAEQTRKSFGQVWRDIGDRHEDLTAPVVLHSL